MKRIEGFISAPFTPMLADGSVNYERIAQYASFYVRNGIDGAFICGTSGEGYSLSLEERKRVAELWVENTPENFKSIVHVGGATLLGSKELVRHAAAIGAWGIGAMAPVFFKPQTVEDLVMYCAELASEAPDMPFYFYHMPSFTGVYLPMLDFLKKAKVRIPNLTGIKYTHEDLFEFSNCLRFDNGRYEILHGRDETLLAGLALGATGGIGGSYNHIMKVYLDLIKAYHAKDLEKARSLQWKAQEFINILNKYGGNVISGKGVMKFLGVDCGPNRLPLRTLPEEEEKAMLKDLENIDFFEFCNK